MFNTIPFYVLFFLKLMSSCHKHDTESKVLVAECLGELGAVDPGRSVHAIHS